MVLQMHLRSHKAAGVVLLSPVPPEGLVTSTLHMAMNHPRVLANLNLLQHLGTAFADAEMFRSALLRPNTPLQEVKPFLPFSQRESQRAIMDMCGLDLPWGTPLQGTPTLVVGGGADALFPPDAFRRAAWLHRADLEILPDFPHALMLDSQWETVAETVLDWLRLRGLSG
jgi:pimeloyl-ACP methyl ester carboxylesterase